MSAVAGGEQLLGFDFGIRQIGVASGHSATGLVTPLEILTCRDGGPPWPAIHALIEEWQPTRLLVGLPLNLDGSEAEITRLARRFGNRLHGRSGLPVSLVDERYSSRAAREQNSQLVKPRAHDRIDDLAASQIVQSYLNSLPA